MSNPNLPEIINRVNAISPSDGERMRKLVTSGSVSFLSADKEVGPFMLYLLGDSIESVAEKTSFPRDVILLTAAQYRWEEKKNALVQVGKEAELIKDVEKNLLNMMLVAVYRIYSKEIGDVLAGRKDPNTARFLPSTMQGLEKLLTMVERVNKLVALDQAPSNPQPAAGSTVVQAQNVQIINNAAPTTPEDRRRLFLKQMAEQKDRI